MPDMQVLGGGVFGRRSGHKGGTLKDGISALRKETAESILASSTIQDAMRRWSSMNQEAHPPLTPDPPMP